MYTGSFDYFNSVLGALFITLMMMTGTNLSTAIVAGSQTGSGASFTVFILVGGIVLELVIMKTFLAVLIDNFETDDRDKIMWQMYQADKLARTEEEDKRHRSVVRSMTKQSDFAFSDFYFTRSLMRQAQDSFAPSNNIIRMQGWGFWSLHSSEVPGKRVWMELIDPGILTCWGVSWASREYVRTGVEVTIPMHNAHIFEQSPARVRIVPQAGPSSFVVRARSTDPSTVSIPYIHMEQVQFVPRA